MGKYSNKIHTNSCVKGSLTELKCVETSFFLMRKVSCAITNYLNKPTEKWIKVMLQQEWILIIL